MFAATILLAQLRCVPAASGTVDCFDAQKGGAPVLRIEPNLFGGYDLRQSDGKLVRCERKATGETRVPGRSGRPEAVSRLCSSCEVAE